MSYYPPNEELLEKSKKVVLPPTMVYRRFHFVDHVPPEYAWTTSDPETMKFGGLGIQRMSLDTWLRVIDDEKATGKPGKCGGNLPKPNTGATATVRAAQRTGEQLRVIGR